FDGQVAVMDVYALQKLVNREGWVDRIDVVPEKDADVGTLLEGIAERVKGIASARFGGRHAVLVEQITGALHLGIWLLVTVSVLVAAFLAYATMSVSVDRRVEEFALLQTAGLEPSRVRRLVYVDAGILAIVGMLLGTALGLGLARWFLMFFAR